MPESRGPDNDWRENRLAEEMASGYGLKLPDPPDGMTRKEWLASLGYSAPPPLPEEKEPSSKDRIHKKQLRDWRGWREN